MNSASKVFGAALTASLVALSVPDAGAYQKPLSERSSKKGFFGIEGRTGQTCSDVELMFRTATFEGAEAFISFRRGPREVRIFPAGEAMFSPNCLSFWRTGLDARGMDLVPVITVHDTKTGRVLGQTDGSEPVWSSDGKSLFFAVALPGRRGGGKLMRWSVAGNRLTAVAEAKDFAPCPPQPGRTWWAPRVKRGTILWKYPTSEKTGKTPPTPGQIETRTQIVDEKTLKVKKTDAGWATCLQPFDDKISKP